MHGAKLLDKQRNLLYPLMLIAAITVIVFCIVGIATMLGWMPNAQSTGEPSARTKMTGREELTSRPSVKPQGGPKAAGR